MNYSLEAFFRLAVTLATAAKVQAILTARLSVFFNKMFFISNICQGARERSSV